MYNIAVEVVHMINILQERWSDILFFILVFVGIFLLFNLYGNIIYLSNEQIIYFLGITLNNWLTIITMFGLIIGGVWTVYQYYKNRKMKQLERATKIAQVFANELGRQFSVIDAILSKYPKLNTLINKIIKSNCSKFTKYELNQVLSTNEIADYLKFISSESTNKEYVKYIHRNYTKNIVSSWPKKFKSLIYETLNKLEYICIDISSNAAGSEYIYESLHTSLLSTILQLYILIALLNQTNVDVLFTNIKFVYNNWNKRRTKDLKASIKAKIEISMITKKLKNKVLKFSSKIETTNKKIKKIQEGLMDKQNYRV